MKDFTTPQAVASAMASHFMPRLLATEDIGKFEASVAEGIRPLAARCVRECLEEFDRSLVESPPRGWTVHSRERRTLLTLVGPVAFERTAFLDRFGRKRLLCDELLGIPPRARLSPGAFLWVVATAAELSYRKTAARFLEETGAAISHVTVMNCVHREGELLKEAGHGSEHVSCAELFCEVDGVWAHLQAESHREEALPRGIYEQARETRSFELKVACLYAGKRGRGNRVERVNLDVTCADEPAEAFWEGVWEMICADYDERDVERVNLGADGGGWCGPEQLRDLMSEKVVVPHYLDLFHVMQAVCRAYPEGPARERAERLVFRGRPGTLAKATRKIASRMPESPRRRRMRDLASYLENNASSIVARAPSMGTMEGTNGHVIAARLKGQGRSWSRRGAEAMGLVRCALAVGRPLVAPPPRVFFTQSEKKAKARFLSKFTGATVPASAGAGWEPPASCNTEALPSRARHAALTGGRGASWYDGRRQERPARSGTRK